MNSPLNGEFQRWNRLFKLMEVIIPVWAFIMLAGWALFVAFGPINQINESQVAETPDNEPAFEMAPASGPSDDAPVIH